MIASFCKDEKINNLDSLPIWNMYGANTKRVSLLFKTNDIASDKKEHIAKPLDSKNMIPATENIFEKK